jgi:hypothetical protein
MRASRPTTQDGSVDDLTAAQLAYLGMAAQVIPVLWVAAFLTGGEAGRRVTIVSAIPLGISAIGLAACISALLGDAMGGSLDPSNVSGSLLAALAGLAAAFVGLVIVSISTMWDNTKLAGRRRREEVPVDHGTRHRPSRRPVFNQGRGHLVPRGRRRPRSSAPQRP